MADAENRRAAILQRLQQHGTVHVTRLAAELGVTEVTIRRDLAALEREGLLVRFHGGAVLPHALVRDVPFQSKLQARQEEKQRIAAAAAALVEEGATVALGAGTTVAAVARALAGKSGLTVVTNAVNIAWEFSFRPEVQLLVTGGRVRDESLCMVGPTAEEALRSVAVDIAFVGVNGISPEFGFTTPNQEEAQVHRLMLSRARRAVVVADSSKFGRVAFALLASLRQVHTLITDTGAPPALVEELRREGIEVLLV
ncbi:MAG: DeoR/GlpR family DNA-binding transcription regulator [Firmicutes bacterium]|nr:DeoR/GlpR family DNA-binding transcription regulator [Bacillota bacterium]